MRNTVLRGIFVAIYGLIFLGTIILNLLAIVYIVSTRDKTTIAVLVVNLAIADIIHAMGIIFFSSNLFTPSWIYGAFGCKFSLTSDVLCTVVIVYTIAALSIERYIDARSIFTAKFRRLITIGSLILIWTLGLLLALPFMTHTILEESTKINGTNSNQIFHCESEMTDNALLAHEIILHILAFLIPYSVIVIFSLKLLTFLRNWLKRKGKLTRTSVTKKRTRGVKLVLCIVLSYLICYTPFWAFKFYTRYLDDNVSDRRLVNLILHYLHLLVVLLNHFEGVLNPLFFIVLTERFCLTFSNHRQRRSRLFGTSSSAVLLTRSNKSSKTATTAQNTEINGLLSIINDHHHTANHEQTLSIR